ncbi:MAG: uncharacterized protein JWM86_682, partial [Thermoleophilia bacterium]|nr:uncharacterized protein [Thermoleophilia bacterium]
RAGRVGAMTCTNGQIIDTTAPVAVASVADGAGADESTQASTTSMSANWPAASDAGGSALWRYRYCVATSTGCGGSIASAGWESTTSTSFTITGLSLMPGSTYYTCVRTQDGAGNLAAQTCSNGTTIAGAAPQAGLGIVVDGAQPGGMHLFGTPPDTEWTSSTTALSGAAYYIGDTPPAGAPTAWCFATTRSCAAPVASGTTFTATWQFQATGLALTNGTLYYACAMIDGQLECSNGQRVDSVAPPQPTFMRDGKGSDQSQTSDTSVAYGNFDAVTDATSGVLRYEVCISSAVTCGGTVYQTWTFATPISSIYATFTNGQSYVQCVRAVDQAGNTGTPRCSNGITVNTASTLYQTLVQDGTSAGGWTCCVSGYTADIDAQQSTTTLTGTTWDDQLFSTAPTAWCFSTAQSCSSGVIASGSTFTASYQFAASGLSLVAGTRYYACATMYSLVVCSNGVILDSVTPAASISVRDGWGSDLSGSSTTLNVRFNAVWAPDGASSSGVLRHEYCVSSVTSCGGTPVVGWTTAPAGGLYFEVAGSYVAGTTYYPCVRSVDRAGRASAAACTGGQVIDYTAPMAPSPLADGGGTDAVWQTSTTAIQANWPAAGDTGGAGVRRYRYCVSTGTGCTGTQLTTGWPALLAPTASFTLGSLSLVDGTTYYTCGRTEDGSGNASAMACSNGVTVDSTAPSSPAPVNDGPSADMDRTSSTSALDANWTASTESGSGLARYDYCISTLAACAGTVARTWTSAALATSVSATGLSLTNATTYFVAVRAVDVAGNVSTIASSDGFMVDSIAPSTPTGLSPAGGSTGTTPPTLTATYTDPAPASPGQLEFQICSVSDCSSVAQNGTSAANLASGSTGSWTPSLAPGTWYWRVRSVDVGGLASAWTTPTSYVLTSSVSVTGLTPSTVPQGRKGLVVQVAGTGFVSGAGVTISGTGVSVASTTWVSATRIDITLNVTDVATLGARTVTATNPDLSTASLVGGLTVTTPSLTLGISSLGFSDAARTGGAGPYTVGFGTLVPGASRDIGPTGSGQTLAGSAVAATITSDTTSNLTVAAATFTGPAALATSALSWKQFGVTEAWTGMSTSAATADALVAPGTTSLAYDFRISIPAAQTPGSYSTTVTYSLVASP